MLIWFNKTDHRSLCKEGLLPMRWFRGDISSLDGIGPAHKHVCIWNWEIIGDALPGKQMPWGHAPSLASKDTLRPSFLAGLAPHNSGSVWASLVLRAKYGRPLQGPGSRRSPSQTLPLPRPVLEPERAHAAPHMATALPLSEHRMWSQVLASPEQPLSLHVHLSQTPLNEINRDRSHPQGLNVLSITLPPHATISLKGGQA